MFRIPIHLLVSLSFLAACGPADNDVTTGAGGAGAGANNAAPDPGAPIVDSIDEDTSYVKDVLSQATDSEGDELSIAITSQPLNGTASYDDLTGEITYTPNLDFNDENNAEVIVYEVSDRFRSTPNTIDITVMPINDAPVANDLTIDDILEDSTATEIDLAALSSDVDTGDVLNLDGIAIEPEHGVVSIDSVNFTASYTPDPDFFGSDSFSYQISDLTGTTATASVQLEIIGQNDAPVAHPADGETVEDSLGQQLDLSLFAEHADPVAMSYSIDTSGLVGGSASIDGSIVTFIPAADFNGDAQFSYAVADTDPIPETASNSVIFNVTPVNDNPVADNGTLTVDEDSTGDIDLALLMSDIDGDQLSITLVTNPGNGSLSNNGSVYTYSPNNNFYGSDSFAYEISDNAGGTASGLITVTINSVNDAPTAADSSDSCDEDSSASTNVVALGSDIDLADTLILSSVGTALNGSVAINGDNAVYTPNPDFFGIDSYTFTLEDGDGETATATITVTVNPVNDAPVAANGNANCDEDLSATSNVIIDLCSDVDTSDVLSLSAVTNGNNGSATIQGGAVVYTPNPDFNGVDTYTFTVVDGNGGQDTGSVTVTVSPVNDNPVAGGTSDSCDEDSSATTALLGGFNSDVDGDVLSLDSVGSATNGTVVIGNGDATFTPDADFNGVATYQYTVSDSFGGTGTGTVTITVNPVNDAPVASDDAFEVLENSQGATLDVLANDSDIDGDQLVVNSIDGSSVTNGSITLNAGLVVFTPDAGYFGDAGSFNYTIEDPSGSTHSATATILVNEENLFSNSLQFELAAATPQPQGYYSKITESGSAMLLNIVGGDPLLTNLDAAGNVLFSASIDAGLPSSTYALTHAALSTSASNEVALAMTFDNGANQASVCMSFDAAGNLLWSKRIQIAGGAHSVSAVTGLDSGGALLAVYSNYLDESILIALDSAGNEVEEKRFDKGAHIVNDIVAYTSNYYLALSNSGLLFIEDDLGPLFHFGGAANSSININSARTTVDGILMAGSDMSAASVGGFSALYDPNLVLNPVLWSNTLADPMSQLDIEHNDLVQLGNGDFALAGAITNVAGGTVVPSLNRLNSTGGSQSLSSYVAFTDGAFLGLIPGQNAANVLGNYQSAGNSNFFTMSFESDDSVISSCSSFGAGSNSNFVSTPDSATTLGLIRSPANANNSNLIQVSANNAVSTLIPSAISREDLCL